MAELVEVPNPPSTSRNEFNCPHCGAHSSQTWFELAAEPIDKGGTPNIPDAEFIRAVKADDKLDDKVKARFISYCTSISSGLVFVEKQESGNYWYNRVHNLYLSKCYTCKKFSVWVHMNLLFPNKCYAIPPNPDLSADVAQDYQEASEILERSPRGAAALLRLAIQKLCVYLGEPGNNINSDIASLVKRGLDKRVQQALDVVRVVGNNAVHPGQMDIRDDKDTARTLFRLVNLIAEKMISEPKHVQGVYDALPESVRKQIERRDK